MTKARDLADSADKDIAGTLTVDAMSVEGDLTVDTNTLHVDSTNNRVGVGASSPDTSLHLSTSSPVIKLQRSGFTPYAQVASNNSGDLWLYADEGNVGSNTSMAFRVDGSEAMRIDSFKRVGINEQNPASGLHVSGSGSQAWVTIEQTTAGSYSIVDFLNANGSRVGYVGSANATNAMYLYNGKAGPISFFTDGTERMTIRSDGIVTRSYQPAFMAYPTGSTSHGNFVSTWATDGDWGSFDNGNNVSSDRFTAPVSGRYQFNIRALYNTGNDAQYTRVFIYKNGSSSILIDGLGDRIYGTGVSADYYLMSYSIVLNLSANDYIQLKADDYGNNGYIYAGRYTSFSGFLI